MPHHKSAIKAVRASKKRAQRNRAATSGMKTLVKKVLACTTKESATPALKQAFSAIDKNAKAGIIHGNNADNKKGRLARFVNALQA